MPDGQNNEMTWPMRRVQAKIGRPLAEVLHQLYVEDGMTLAEVGAEIGRLASREALSESTVSRWMDTLDIDRRFPGKRAKAEVA